MGSGSVAPYPQIYLSMSKRRFDKLEVWLVAGAAVTLLVTAAAVFYSLGFVSTNLYRALSPGEGAWTAIKFDVEGYEALGL
jgi:hypothetical protein